MKPLCDAVSPSRTPLPPSTRYPCTREPGHPGPHRHLKDGRELCRWVTPAEVTG